MMITWRRLTAGDFPMLAGWLARPHVARWWNHETSPEAVERDFGPASRGEEPAEDLLCHLDGTPFGLVQRCRFGDYPEYIREMAPVHPVSPEMMTLDYLIGDPELTGRGLGTEMIRSVVGATWTDHPDVPAIVVPVSAHNRASWRVLERAGFLRVAEGELEPDTPVDDRAHFVYRRTRP